MGLTRLSPAIRQGFAIAIATGLYGISFGAIEVTAGLNVWQAMLLSLLMFTGGSQFAFIGVIGGGGTGWAAFTAASLLGIRNGIYGVQLSALLRPAAALVPVMAHVTIDESMATATAQQVPAEQRRGFWAAGIGVFVCWNLCTLLGALAGDALGDPRAWGLDGAAVAAFTGLLWPRLTSIEPIAIAILGAAVTLLFIPLVPPGLPIVLAAVVCAAALVVRR